MNWLDEGSLYSSISIFLREDLGRGDLTTQATIARNTRARGRFIAGEKMIIAGLEAAEEVFVTLDPQQQIEAFAADGEEIDAGKVIARASGFADVMLAGERVALNLLQHLSGIATLTREYVRAVDGTGAQIVDTRKTTPGLRMLEKYAVLLGGGRNSRYGLDDGILVKANHISICGGVSAAVKSAREKVSHLHKIIVQVDTERDLREAVETGADALSIEGQSPAETARLVEIARQLAPAIIIAASGKIDLANVRAFAEAGVNLISVGMLTSSARSMDISFQIQPF
jgi:nicotinate-nucleotide pyrophosphorylase (carboxylating)